MIKKEDLWVGDWVTILSSGRTGTFVGVKEDGRLRIKVDDKVILCKETNLELAPEEKHEKVFIIDETSSQKSSFKVLPSTIDLHIEKLNPHLVNALPERIADFQLKSFENYIHRCIEMKRKTTIIIHGKGRGELKTAIHTMLSSLGEVHHFQLIHNSGATEVFFNY